MRRRFFVERFEGAKAVVSGETGEHLSRVLRAAPGQLYELSDGERVWLGRVESAKRGAVEFALIEPLPAVEPALEISLLLAIVKFDRMEWCLEKATELGVSEVVPLAAARSEKALIVASARRAARWERILRESAQQARRLRPPALREAMKPEAAFTAADADLRLLCSEERDAPPMKRVIESRTGAEKMRRVALAVGPEGGWTEEELQSAKAAEFAAVSLGENILRTETAVIAALAMIHYGTG
jgi:16S rRNA (uracil1498-N3)-methyltransferase